MYRRIMTHLSPLLLASLALSAVVAPQALGAPLQTTTIVATNTGPLLLQTQQGDYRKGFRDGYRQGHDDGLVDGQLDCGRKREAHRYGRFSQSEYDRGFADGYPKGYESGYARYCGR
jgi:hypothetical protein